MHCIGSAFEKTLKSQIDKKNVQAHSLTGFMPGACIFSAMNQTKSISFQMQFKGLILPIYGPVPINLKH